MAPIFGLGAITSFKPVSAISFGEAQKPEQSSKFIQNTIASKYSLTFPKADNSVPGGDSPLGAKLPRLYA
ncbi:MAG: hypothetical protein VZR09_06825 [Candidatus Gastranaerophilaceae bacterium]|nr:hypothetical protein [Candidatus Gastranaerophilaceae bacterium]